MTSKRSIIGLILVGGISFFATRYYPIAGLIGALSSCGWISSMVGLVIVIVRENLTHERALELQGRQQLFEFGAAEHMAAAIFDKHIVFCEEYIQALFDGLIEIDSAGPDKRMADVAKKLWDVRRRHLAWISGDLDKELIGIENTLRSMAVDSARIQYLSPGKDRDEIFKRMYDQFHKFYGMVKSEDKEATLSSIIEQFRELLGVRELIQVRNKIVRKFAGGQAV